MNYLSIVLQIAFWIGLIGVATPLLLYPPLLFAFSRFRRNRLPWQSRPSVTLVISAYNEAEVIQEKLENALALDYPPELLEILVISDASDDGTDDIVRRYADRRVRLGRQEERLGKSAGLSRFCPEARGEILVFTDANSMFRPDALTKLVRHFDDPKVGYTVGRQLYRHSNGSASAKSENAYWNYELVLKAWESRLSSVVGADGAIYALRKELFEPLAPEDINDFVLPLKVVAKGYRGVFDPEAVCYEDAAPDFRGEFRRKYRIVNRSVRAVCKVPQSLNPIPVGWFAFQLLAHKVLRWFAPFFLVTMLAASVGLAASGSTIFGMMLGLQLAGYGCALMYHLPALRRVRIVYLAHYFLLINIAAAMGILLLVRGRTIGTWKPQR